jgi:hypothetical protein
MKKCDLSGYFFLMVGVNIVLSAASTRVSQIENTAHNARCRCCRFSHNCPSGRERTFSLLIHISTFKNYLIGRCFRRWRRGMRQTTFRRVLLPEADLASFWQSQFFQTGFAHSHHGPTWIRSVDFHCKHAAAHHSLEEYVDDQVPLDTNRNRLFQDLWEIWWTLIKHIFE